MDRCNENVIEWLCGDKEVCCTFTQKKFVNKIRKMSETHGELIKILAENQDGSLMARIPLRALHLTIYAPKTGSFTKVSDNDLEEDEDGSDE